jgi:hypothetical protein
MEKRILVLFIFFFSVVCYGQNSSNTKVTLAVHQMQDARDLSLLNYSVFKNQNYIYSYAPLKYSENLHAFDLEIITSTENFLEFLLQPKVGFFLEQALVDDNNIDIYFQRAPIQSYNYPSFFLGSKLEESIELFFDDSSDYDFWKPDMIELENNDNFLANNPITVDTKLFATLNTRQDRDFYSIKTMEAQTLHIEINSFQLKEPVVLNIYDEKFSLFKKNLLALEQPLHQFILQNPPDNQVIYLEFLNDKKKGVFAGSKNFNANYIFSIFYE